MAALIALIRVNGGDLNEVGGYFDFVNADGF